MSHSDKFGRKYAKLSACRPGASLIVDDGFDCMKAWSHRTIKRRADGELYVDCKSGGHALDGQADNGEHLVGMYHAQGFMQA